MSNVPLPEPLGFYFPPRAYQDTPSTEMVGLFSDDQMHTFAAAVSAADNAALRERVRVLEDALLRVARMAEALKKDCGMDPESPQAVRNGQYMNISYAARAALAARKGEA